MANFKIDDLEQKKHLKSLLEEELQQQLQALSIEEINGIRESISSENSIAEFDETQISSYYGWNYCPAVGNFL